MTAGMMGLQPHGGPGQRQNKSSGCGCECGEHMPLGVSVRHEGNVFRVGEHLRSRGTFAIALLPDDPVRPKLEIVDTESPPDFYLAFGRKNSEP